MRFIEPENLIPRRTSISNIFFDTFLKDAEGDFVKVYLYAYYLCKEKLAMSTEEFNSSLHMSHERVSEAVDYWVNTGLMEVKDGDLIIHDADSLTIQNIVGNKVQAPVDPELRLVEANRDPEIREMFRQVDFIVRRQLVPEEKKTVLSWVMDYHMSPDMVLHAISYTFEEKKACNLNYAGAMIRNWYDKSYTTLDEVIDNSDLESATEEMVRKALNLKVSQMTPAVSETIAAWRTKLGFSDDIIALACAQTINIREPNIKYVDSVLKAWHDGGVKDLDDARKMIENKPTALYNKNSKMNDYYISNKRQTDDYSEDELKALLGIKGGL